MIPVEVYNEGQAEPLTLKFYDADGNALVPTTAKYRIDCDSNDGKEVRDWTNLTPASAMTINIESSDTAIIDDNNEEEVRRVTVLLNEGLSSQYTDECVYVVKNLTYFTS